MTVIWLLVWLIHGTPALHTNPSWNNWMISLVICLALDFGGGVISSKRHS